MVPFPSDMLTHGTDTRGKKTFVPVRLAATLFALTAVIFGCSVQQGVPTIERLAQQINKGVMCPVCPGESIDQSQHPLAVQMRRIVAEKLDQGWTKGQINDFFVERYGPSVLLEPPREGFNLVVWLVPPAVFAAAGAALYLVMRVMVRSRAIGSDGAVGAAEMSEEERAGYIGRVEAALALEEDSGPADAHGAGDEAVT
jgi:cytochrome c-type biogenesis protein CcmH